MQTPKRRAIVYIDGYNWYHAIFKHHPEWKWLNIQTFFEALRPDEEIIAVKMFSAMVNPTAKTSDDRDRQQRYFDALRTLSKVKIILGMFQEREVTCRGRCREKYRIQDEKKTDVNIAVEVINDVLNGACEKILIVSGDSDVQPVVEWVVKHQSEIQVTVYVPALKREEPFRRTDYYKSKRINADCKFLPLSNLQEHQLKGAVRLPTGNFVVRPESWK